jgi:hypothetical protein
MAFCSLSPTHLFSFLSSPLHAFEHGLGHPQMTDSPWWFWCRGNGVYLSVGTEFP